MPPVSNLSAATQNCRIFTSFSRGIESAYFPSADRKVRLRGFGFHAGSFLDANGSPLAQDPLEYHEIGKGWRLTCDLVDDRNGQRDEQPQVIGASGKDRVPASGTFTGKFTILIFGPLEHQPRTKLREELD